MPETSTLTYDRYFVKEMRNGSDGTIFICFNYDQDGNVVQVPSRWNPNHRRLESCALNHPEGQPLAVSMFPEDGLMKDFIMGMGLGHSIITREEAESFYQTYKRQHVDGNYLPNIKPGHIKIDLGPINSAGQLMRAVHHIAEIPSEITVKFMWECPGHMDHTFTVVFHADGATYDNGFSEYSNIVEAIGELKKLIFGS